MSEMRILGGRFPCCERRLRHELEVGVEREVACPRCGKKWVALLVAGSDRALELAGRPVGKVEFRAVAA